MLETKRVRAELARVQSAKYEMEYQIELKREEIIRLEASLAKQETAEIEIQNKLKQLEQQGPK